jgi:hypothetical protein
MDSDRWEDRPSTGRSGCGPEPLDDRRDCYRLREPIADDQDLVDKGRYLTRDGEPMTHFDAVGSYIQQRHSEGTTAQRYGWTKGRQYYARKQYAKGMALDRQLLSEYDDPTTALLSLRISPPDAGRLNMLEAVGDGADVAIDQLRYRLQYSPDAPFGADEWEYIVVFAGTKLQATPHLHLYVWTDGDLERERLDPVVRKFVNECEFAPDDGTGNDPDDGAVRIRGNGDDSVPRVDDDELDQTDCDYVGSNSQGAVYVLTQLPLADVDRMARDELLHSAVVDAWSGQPFRCSLSADEVEERFQP